MDGQKKSACPGRNEDGGWGEDAETLQAGGMGGLSSPAAEAGSRRRRPPVSTPAEMPLTQYISIPQGQLTLRYEHSLVR